MFRYGIEAPYVPLGMVAGGVALIVLGAFVAGPWPIGFGVLLLVEAAVFLYATLRGKFVVWARELDRLGLRGDEQVLDLGCGRGTVLIAVARRLPKGKAVGVDIWRTQDQSGNSEAVAVANAEADGVADRIELHTADITELPFADDSFDVVTSALVIHNISDAQARSRALDEAVRVLRPGGRLLLADFRHARDYARHLTTLGVDAQVRSLGPRYWYGGPWTATSMVSGAKPAAA